MLTIEIDGSGASAVAALGIVDKMLLYTQFDIDGVIFVAASSTAFSVDGVRMCVADLMSSLE